MKDDTINALNAFLDAVTTALHELSDCRELNSSSADAVDTARRNLQLELVALQKHIRGIITREFKYRAFAGHLLVQLRDLQPHLASALLQSAVTENLARLEKELDDIANLK